MHMCFFFQCFFRKWKAWSFLAHHFFLPPPPVFYLFLLAKNILFQGYTALPLSINKLMNIVVCSLFGYYEIQLWTFIVTVVCRHIFIYFVYTSTSEITGFYGNFMFNLLGNCYNVSKVAELFYNPKQRLLNYFSAPKIEVNIYISNYGKTKRPLISFKWSIKMIIKLLKNPIFKLWQIIQYHKDRTCTHNMKLPHISIKILYVLKYKLVTHAIPIPFFVSNCLLKELYFLKVHMIPKNKQNNVMERVQNWRLQTPGFNHSSAVKSVCNLGKVSFFPSKSCFPK